MKFSVSKSLLALLAVASGVVAQDKGSIVKPAAGTALVPGQPFDFEYFGLADYGVSSYAYSVWLLTADVVDKPLTVSKAFTSGVFLGRFDYPNYPAVPYAAHPAPAQLTTPDFSKAQGGWGSGLSASNVNLTLAVFEETADGAGSIGHKISFAAVPVIYNATLA
ncbi:hypothetical protein BXZ70DRAFT_922062 [Cristinia sonorae]|uniref:Uncharacterized protein n=1 Tax=Cristinia sonorae TaxID=1940300 RepID=A0A8K0XTJ6_9AGAR|nr:hypothetical protein BXZ70DRAFT_922062 [Cristinia sonorae]